MKDLRNNVSISNIVNKGLCLLEKQKGQRLLKSSSPKKKKSSRIFAEKKGKNIWFQKNDYLKKWSSLFRNAPDPSASSFIRMPEALFKYRKCSGDTSINSHSNTAVGVMTTGNR